MADAAVAASAIVGHGGFSIEGFLAARGTLYMIADSEHEDAPSPLKIRSRHKLMIMRRLSQHGQSARSGPVIPLRQITKYGCPRRQNRQPRRSAVIPRRDIGQ